MRKPAHLKSGIVKLAGLGLFIWILSRIDLNTLAGILLDARVSCLVWTALLFYPIILLKALRWKTLLNVNGPEVGLGKLFVAYTSSYYAGTVTPGRVGEFSRILYLKNLGLTSGTAAFSVIVDRTADVLILAALAGGGILLFGSFLQIVPDTPVLLLSAAATALALVLARRIPVAGSLKRLLPEGIRHRAADALADFTRELRNLRPRTLVRVGVWTLLAWGLCILQVLMLGEALGITIPPAYLVGAYALSALAGMLPVTIAGIGTRDALLIVLFALAGANRESAVAFSLLLLLLSIVQGLQSLPFWVKWPLVKKTSEPSNGEIAECPNIAY